MGANEEQGSIDTAISRINSILSVGKNLFATILLLWVLWLVVKDPYQMVPPMRGVLLALRDSGFTKVGFSGLESDLTRLNEAASTSVQGTDSALRSLEIARRELHQASSRNPGKGTRAQLDEASRQIDNAYNSLSKSRQEANSIITNTPKTTSSQKDADSPGSWLVIAGADSTLEAAKDEYKSLASFKGARILLRSGLYRTVVAFEDKNEALSKAVGISAAVNRQAFVVESAKWCPATRDRADYSECVLLQD